MASFRSVLRDLFVPGLARFVAAIGFLFAYVGLVGPIARVLEHGWYEGLFTGATVVFLLSFVAGIVLLKWIYPFLPPSSRTKARP